MQGVSAVAELKAYIQTIPVNERKTRKQGEIAVVLLIITRRIDTVTKKTFDAFGNGKLPFTKGITEVLELSAGSHPEF